MPAAVALHLLLLGGIGLLAILVALVALRKIRRDRDERDARRRRATIVGALAGYDAAVLWDVCRDAKASWVVRYELARALEGAAVGEDGRALARACAADAGLHARLVGDLRARSPITRGRAVLLLSRLGTDDAAGLLEPLLRDPDPDVRLAACAGLAELGTPAAADALVAALGAGRMTPERVIERLAAPWALAPLLAALEAPPAAPSAGGPPVRALLARTLGLIGDPAAVTPLVGLLTGGDAHEEERISAARALGEIGDPAAAGVLVDALADSSWPVRAQAAKALGALRAADAVPALAGLLGDPAWWVRSGAARALREIGPAGIAALEEARGHPDRYARDRVAEELAVAGMAG